MIWCRAAEIAALRPFGVLPIGLLDEADSLVALRQLRCDLTRAVPGGPEGQDQLQFSAIVLVQDTGHGFDQVPFLVEDRHDHRNRRPVG